MSSVPFCLGVPVVDDIPAESGIYVLRTRSYHDLELRVIDLQNRLSKRDLIRLYIIGYRPDKPIPVGRVFTEVEVDIGGAQKWQSIFGRWYVGAYHRIATGMDDVSYEDAWAITCIEHSPTIVEAEDENADHE